MSRLRDAKKPDKEIVGCEAAADDWAQTLNKEVKGEIVDVKGQSLIEKLNGKAVVTACEGRVDIKKHDGTIVRTSTIIDTKEQTASVVQAKLRPQGKGDPKLVESIGADVNLTDKGGIGDEVAGVTIKANANDKKGTAKAYSALNEDQQTTVDELVGSLTTFAKKAGLGLAVEPAKKPALRIGASL